MRRRARTPHSARRRARRGFTLIEVLMSIGIMSAVLIGMAAFVQQGQHNVSVAALATTASDRAVERVETVKAQSNYAALDALVEAQTALPDAPGFTRTTALVRTNTAAGDYKTITVTVTHAGMPSPIRKTVVIAAY